MVQTEKRVKLTEARIARFRYEGVIDGKVGSRDVRWDAALPGFGVRVYPSNRKAYVLSYRHGTQKRLMVVGDVAAFALAKARRLARQKIELLEEGTDPLEEKRRAVQGGTLGQLLDRYIDEHARPHKKTWEADERRLERNVPAAWRSRKADAITFDDLSGLHRRIGERAPYEANRLIEILRKAFNLAPRWRFVESTAPNPARGIQRFSEHKRSAVSRRKRDSRSR